MKGTIMTNLNQFDLNVYSEELYAGVSESDYAEVMAADAVEDGWQGYSDWSAELEQAAFEQEQEKRATVNTSNGSMLIKRECSHRGCGFQCGKAESYAGIAI
jgi:hypothetical protein